MVFSFVVLKRIPSKGGEMFRRFSRFKLESKEVSAVKFELNYCGSGLSKIVISIGKSTRVLCSKEPEDQMKSNIMSIYVQERKVSIQK